MVILEGATDLIAHAQGADDQILADRGKLQKAGRRLVAGVAGTFGKAQADAGMMVSEEVFGSTMRHDMRTPINQVVGYAEILIEDRDLLPSPDFVPEIERIKSAGRQMQSDIDRVKASMEP